jgi:hypothetical protein
MSTTDGSTAAPVTDPAHIEAFVLELFQDAPGWLVFPYFHGGKWKGR